MSSEKDKSQNFNHLQVNMPEPCPGSRGSYPSPQSGAPTARRMERQRRGGWSAEGAIHYSLGRRPSGRRPRNAAVRVRPHNPARRRRGGWSAKGATYYSLGRRPSGRRPRKPRFVSIPTIRRAGGAADGAPRARYIIAWVGGRQAAGPGKPRFVSVPTIRRANGAADGAPRARHIIAWVGGRQAAGPGKPPFVSIPQSGTPTARRMERQGRDTL